MSLADNIIKNRFLDLLENATPAQYHDYIVKNESLFKNTNWENVKRVIALIPGIETVKLDYETIINILADERPDLLAVICSTPGGIQWMNVQIQTIHTHINR